MNKVVSNLPYAVYMKFLDREVARMGGWQSDQRAAIAALVKKASITRLPMRAFIEANRPFPEYPHGSTAWWAENNLWNNWTRIATTSR